MGRVDDESTEHGRVADVFPSKRGHDEANQTKRNEWKRRNMSFNIATVHVVLVHGAWADGSSWNKVITGRRARGIASVAAPLPLTALADDVAALARTLERVDAPVVLVGHAYAGAVIAETGEKP